MLSRKTSRNRCPTRRTDRNRKARSLRARFSRLRLEQLEDRRVLGGGGENILLVVNPGDEYALRIANAYQQLRGVPDSNVVFIAPPTSNGSYQSAISATVLRNTFITPLASEIPARGLTGQIDYIGTIGQPNFFAAACRTARRRGSSAFFRRNSSGSIFSKWANSSIWTSRAK